VRGRARACAGMSGRARACAGMSGRALACATQRLTGRAGRPVWPSMVRYRCDAVVSDRQVSVACRERVRSLHVGNCGVRSLAWAGAPGGCDVLDVATHRAAAARAAAAADDRISPGTAALRPSGRQRVVGLNRSARREMRVAVSGALRDRPHDVEICLTACNNINHATRSTQRATRNGFCKGHQALSSKWR
jgi:hypothetical protein